VKGLSCRFGVAEERLKLEELQRRASLVYDAYRDALLANPDAIHLPLSQLEEKQVRVAEQGGLVLGFTAVLPREGGVCDLDGLFVEPDRWRRGIGRALMQDAFVQARSSGMAVMEVLGNPHAEGFYVKLGFVRAGTVMLPFGMGLKMHRRL
jgi:GNAT superfamily N-acetyltransferase